MLICLECWEVYDHTLLKEIIGYGTPCPKKHCEGDAVEIDECLLPAIKMLNEKGYTTAFCCSGHLWQGAWSGTANAYISFEEWVSPEPFAVLPEGVTIEQASRGCVVLRWRLQSTDPNDLYIKLLESAIRITKWVETLPDLDVEADSIEGSELNIIA